MVEGVDVYGANSLSEVVQFLRGEKAMEPVRSTSNWSDAGSVDQELDFGEVKGQQHVKRAVAVAAAGSQYSNLWTYSVPPSLNRLYGLSHRPFWCWLSGTYCCTHGRAIRIGQSEPRSAIIWTMTTVTLA
jgi:hypothetical protein